MVDLIIVIIGMFCCILLFYKIPSPDGHCSSQQRLPVSVVIPARNEEQNIALLLEDLMKQTVQPFEIICVDDGSTDRTAETILDNGATLVRTETKPDGWIGKSWACHNGAGSVQGDLILFLDADVRLHPDALEELCCSYHTNGGVISVQPYHRVRHPYEQLSFFFNLVQIAGNGLGSLFQKNRIGLFGPVILIGREDYIAINGHNGARGSITDDLALGDRLKKADINFRLFLGGRNISYRMYSSGLKDLFQGWTKNFATGASKTPPATFIAVFAWITSCLSTVIEVIMHAVAQDLPRLVIWLALYSVWVAILLAVSARAGSFSKTVVLFYPVLLATFLIVFVVSLVKRLFHFDVIWKDRRIGTGY
ncbi:MAG: glycosyltransferase family 2 protein [Saccharofermentanales bacterium]